MLFTINSHCLYVSYIQSFKENRMTNIFKAIFTSNPNIIFIFSSDIYIFLDGECFSNAGTWVIISTYFVLSYRITSFLSSVNEWFTGIKCSFGAKSGSTENLVSFPISNNMDTKMCIFLSKVSINMNQPVNERVKIIIVFKTQDNLLKLDIYTKLHQWNKIFGYRNHLI